MIILTTNICLYSYDQINPISKFIIKNKADVVFFQEGNGCIEYILKELINLDPENYHNASINLQTHILIRNGKFIRLTDTWPYNFYSKAIINNNIFILVNIHLCEIHWDTKCDKIEHKYRCRNITNMLNYLSKIYNINNYHVIIAGDFNTFSHLDKSSVDTLKTVYPSKVLESFGFTDSWNYCNYSIDNEEDGISWPVPLYCISNDFFLKSEIKSLTRLRIDFIYGNKNLLPLNCVMKYNEEWYSDHKAVITTYKVIDIISNNYGHSLKSNEISLGETGALKSNEISLGETGALKSNEISLGETGALELKVEFNIYGFIPKWKLTCNGLSGEKNHYIEIHCIKNGNEKSVGYFYIDGLQNTYENSLLLINLFHHSTFNPLDEIDKDAYYKAILFNEAQEELLHSKF